MSGPVTTAKDVVWTAVAAVMALAAVSGLITVAWGALTRGAWLPIVGAPIGVLFY